ncbi:class I SAM-dependent methyltransferase [Cytophaga aurantiaca]|uniref:class I SAM-dependent methyltransferase n=1 Tax=Cytophaga aurantiaca TaxID=29530 RepID=UPI000361FEB3|nr:class I SAM-dependent methyltransferase [Cytophaga aurantiaca]
MKNTEFLFKKIDNEGIETLTVLASANKLNMWFYDTIKPFCTGKILEIGSGIGNISHFFIQNKNDITLSDLRANYLESLTNRFPDFQKTNFHSLDLVDVDFDTKHKDKFNSFDTIFALNVVEHIFDDQQAIKNCYKLLKKGGRLIILVPAYQSLYNRFDKELQHYRRYNQTTLNTLFINAEFKLEHNQYFNAMGIMGWFISGRILNNKLLPEGQIKFYNTFVPFFKIIDKILFKKIGLSVMAVGKK